MFTRRLSSSLSILKAKRIHRVSLQEFSNNSKNDFPYVFGGIQKHAQKNQYKTLKQQLFDLLLRNQIDGFKMAYKQLLLGFESQDKQFLANILEPKLLRRQYPPTKVINKDADVKIEVCNIILCLNMPYDRSNHPELIGKVLIDNILAGSQNGVCTFIVQLYFESNMKLITEDSSETQKQQQKQIHMVQFECQKKITILQLYVIQLTIIFRFLFTNDHRTFEFQMQQFMLKDSSDWRITDIDRNLNGNLPKIFNRR